MVAKDPASRPSWWPGSDLPRPTDSGLDIYRTGPTKRRCNMCQHYRWGFYGAHVARVHFQPLYQTWHPRHFVTAVFLWFLIHSNQLSELQSIVQPLQDGGGGLAGHGRRRGRAHSASGRSWERTLVPSPHEGWICLTSRPVSGTSTSRWLPKLPNSWPKLPAEPVLAKL